MTHPHRLSVLVIVLLAGGCACEAPDAACGPDLCTTGCCDSMGLCVGGQTPFACGTSGAACGVCLGGDVCAEGVCLPSPRAPEDAGGQPADAGADAGDPAVDAGGAVDAGVFDAGGPRDAGAPDAGSAAPDAGARDAGVAVQTDGGLLCVAPTSINLSYDVAPVTVSGTLTMNGQLLPAGSRGFLQFIDRESGGLVNATLAASGPSTFTAPLLRGTYDVTFSSPPQVSGMPSGRGVVVRGFVVSASSTQAWNVDTVTVSGSVTLDGVAPPAVGQFNSRGVITFRDAADLTAVSFELARTGPATYAGVIFAGTLDVEFETTVPRSARAVFARAAPFTSNTTRVDDLPFGTVTATVTINGQSVNWQTLTLASLEFVNLDTNQTSYGGVSAAAPSIFTLTVPRGTYDVFFQTHLLRAPPAPANARVLLARAVTVGPTATFAWQVRTHDVTATLTLDGLGFPERGGADRGLLWFHEVVGAKQVSVPLPLTGPATVTLRLAEGTYDVGYQPPAAPFPGVPGLNRVVIARGVVIAANTVLALEPATTTLDVSFSVNGVLRGGLSWYDGLTLGNDWAGRDGVLFPLGGTSRMPVLVYQHTPLDVFGFATPTGPSDATGVATLLRGKSFAGPQVLALNATTVVASGTVTLNGLPVPDGVPNDRGQIDVLNFETGGRDRFSFGTTGPVSFPGKQVFAGPVDVILYPLSAQFAPQGLPARYLARACLGSACRTTSTNLTGNWTVRFSGDFAQFARFQLVESSSGITGDVVVTGDRFAIDRSTRAGNTIRWTTSESAAANDPTTYTVELESPCRMSGSIHTHGYSTAHFTAIR